MEILDEESKIDEQSPGVDAKMMHSTLASQDNKTKINNMI